MKTIWKFELGYDSIQTISMPIRAEILDLQVHEDVPCIWALVDTEAKLQKRTFIICTTGNEAKVGDCEYIGTFQTVNGTLVFHLFERYTQITKEKSMSIQYKYISPQLSRETDQPGDSCWDRTFRSEFPTTAG